MSSNEEDVLREVGRTFAYSSVGTMMTVLSAFSPALSRSYPTPQLRPAGSRRDPDSREYLSWTQMEFQVGHTPRTRTRIMLQGPQQEIEAEDLEQLGRELARTLGPEGMKHLYGLLIALDENYHSGHFIFDTDEHLDRLGYQRREQDGRFYHHPANVRKAREIARMFTSLTLHIDCEGADKRLVVKLFTEWGREETYCSKKCKWEDREAPELEDVRQCIQERKVIGANPIWYGGVSQEKLDQEGAGRQYTRQLKSLATEDAHAHGITLLLGGLLPIKWRMNGCCPVRVSTKNLMEWAGLDADDTHRGLLIRKLHDELDYMRERGYIGEWEVEPRGEQLQDLVVILAPDWLEERLQGIREARVTKVVTSTPKAPADEADKADEMDGQELRRLREEAGLSVREFAREVGTSRSTVSMVENGDRKLTEDLAEKVRQWVQERGALSTNLDISTPNLDISTPETPHFWTSQPLEAERGLS